MPIPAYKDFYEKAKAAGYPDDAIDKVWKQRTGSSGFSYPEAIGESVQRGIGALQLMGGAAAHYAGAEDTGTGWARAGMERIAQHPRLTPNQPLYGDEGAYGGGGIPGIDFNPDAWSLRNLAETVPEAATSFAPMVAAAPFGGVAAGAAGAAMGFGEGLAGDYMQNVLAGGAPDRWQGLKAGTVVALLNALPTHYLTRGKMLRTGLAEGVTESLEGAADPLSKGEGLAEIGRAIQEESAVFPAAFLTGGLGAGIANMAGARAPDEVPDAEAEKAKLTQTLTDLQQQEPPQAPPPAPPADIGIRASATTKLDDVGRLPPMMALPEADVGYTIEPGEPVKAVLDKVAPQADLDQQIAALWEGVDRADEATASVLEEAENRLAATFWDRKEREVSQNFQPVPHRIDRLFTSPPGTVMVPLEKIRPVRRRKRGVVNAYRYMHLAAAGQGNGSPRKPIELMAQPDGTYTLLDGNSTYAVAKQSGWPTIPATIVADRPTISAHMARHGELSRLNKGPDTLYKHYKYGPENMHRLRQLARSVMQKFNDAHGITEMEQQRFIPPWSKYKEGPKAGQVKHHDKSMHGRRLLSWTQNEKGERFPLMEWKDPGLKPFESAQAKVARNHGDATKLEDIVRGTIVTRGDRKNLDEWIAYLKDLIGEENFRDEGWQATSMGYADRKLKVRMTGNQWAEIQVMPSEMFDSKDYSHKHYYEPWRKFAVKGKDGKTYIPDHLKAQAEPYRQASMKYYVDNVWSKVDKSWDDIREAVNQAFREDRIIEDITSVTSTGIQRPSSNARPTMSPDVLMNMPAGTPSNVPTTGYDSQVGSAENAAATSSMKPSISAERRPLNMRFESWGRSKMVRGLEDPTEQDLMRLARDSEQRQVRGIRLPDGREVWWDAADAIHDEIERALGIPRNIQSRFYAFVTKTGQLAKINDTAWAEEGVVDRLARDKPIDTDQRQQLVEFYGPNVTSKPTITTSGGIDYMLMPEGQVRTPGPAVTKDGKHYGAPKGKPTDSEVNTLAYQLADIVRSHPDAQNNRWWYKRAGNYIASYARNDPVAFDKMVRLVAFMSADTNLGGNVTAMVDSAWQVLAGKDLAKGLGKYPNSRGSPKNVNAILSAKTFDKTLPGVSDKVMSFYRNIINETVRDGRLGEMAWDGEVTLDVWMHRLLGYDSVQETFAGRQYGFSKMLVQLATNMLNRNALTQGEQWTPAQTQAALWAYARGAWQNLPADIKKGIRKSEPTDTRSAAMRKARQYIWDNRAADIPHVYEGIEDHLEKASAFASWEAFPNSTARGDTVLKDAPLSVREEFHREAYELLLDSKGIDQVLARIDAKLAAVGAGFGTWMQMNVQPNSTTSLVLPRSDSKARNTQIADLYSALIGYIYEQDMVPWHMPDPKGDIRGLSVAIDAEQRVDPMEVADLLRNENVDFDYTHIKRPDGKVEFRFLNFTGMSDKAFYDKLEGTLEAALDSYGVLDATNMKRFRATGNALTNDWKENPNGEELRETIRKLGRSDLLDWADDRRQAYRQLLAQKEREVGSATQEFKGARRRTEPVKLVSATDRQTGEASQWIDVTPIEMGQWREFEKFLWTLARDGMPMDVGAQWGTAWSLAGTSLQGFNHQDTNDIVISPDVINRIVDPAFKQQAPHKYVQALQTVAHENTHAIHARLGLPVMEGKAFAHFDISDLSALYSFDYLMRQVASGDARDASDEMTKAQRTRAQKQMRSALREFFGPMLAEIILFINTANRNNPTEYSLWDKLSGYPVGQYFQWMQNLIQGIQHVQALEGGDAAIEIAKKVKNGQLVVPGLEGGASFQEAIDFLTRELLAQMMGAFYVSRSLENESGELKEMSSFKPTRSTSEVYNNLYNFALEIHNGWSQYRNDPAKFAGAISGTLQSEYRGAPVISQGDLLIAADRYAPGGTGDWGGNTGSRSTISADRGDGETGRQQRITTEATATDPTGRSYSTNGILGGFTSGEIQLVQDVVTRYGGEMERQSRGKRSWDATEEAALAQLEGETGITNLRSLLARKPGQAANAEQLLSYGKLLAAQTGKVRELAKTISENSNDDDVVRAYAELEKLSLLLAPTMGAMTEAGRSLNILNKVATEARTARDLVEQMSDVDVASDVKGKGDFRAQVLAIMDRVNESPPDVTIAMAKRRYRHTGWDKFYELWINSILSGYRTHQTNIFSNALYQVLENANLFALGMIPGTGISMSEVAARVHAIPEATRLAAKLARDAWIQDAPQLTPVQKTEQERFRAIKGRKGKWIRTPGRALLAEDEFFKGMAYYMELSGLAMRAAKGSKVRYAEIMADISVHPAKYQDMIGAAKRAADKLTFTTKLGPSMSAFNRALNKSKFGKLIIPFVRTPTNILRSALEWTPLGGVMENVRDDLRGKNGKVAQSVAAGRMAFGSGTMMVTMGLVSAGLLTGQGPDDPNEKRMLRQTGWEPYSLKIGNKWVKYNRFEPVGMVLGLAADIGEIHTYASATDLDKIAMLALSSLQMNLSDKTFLSGLTDFINMWDDPQRFAQRYIARQASSMVPNFVGQIAQDQDPYMREASTMIEGIRGKIPGMRQSLRPVRDLAGQPVESSNIPGTPFRATERKRDPLAESMLKLGIFKGAPGKSIANVKLTEDQHDSLEQAVGEARYKHLMPMVSSPQFQQMIQRQPEIARTLLEKQWDRVTTDAKTRWLMQNPDVLSASASRKREPRAIGSNYLD